MCDSTAIYNVISLLPADSDSAFARVVIKFINAVPSCGHAGSFKRYLEQPRALLLPHFTWARSSLPNVKTFQNKYHTSTPSLCCPPVATRTNPAPGIFKDKQARKYRWYHSAVACPAISSFNPHHQSSLPSQSAASPTFQTCRLSAAESEDVCCGIPECTLCYGTPPST